MTNAKIGIKWKKHRFQSTSNVSYSNFNYERTKQNTKRIYLEQQKIKKKYVATVIMAA